MRLDGLVNEIEALGPAYRLHASLLRIALKKKARAETAVVAAESVLATCSPTLVQSR
jgi:hypothetical protein